MSVRRSSTRDAVSRLAGVWLLVAAGGCGAASNSGKPEPASGGDAQPGLTRVTLALNWFPEAEHGGFYAALKHGYYKDAGLDVEILPGGPKAPVLQQVATGQVDFAVDNADKLLLARAQEADVVAVMAPIQDSPRCIIVHAESGIATFEQLAAQTNFTLAMNPGQPFAQFLTRKLNLSRLQIAPYPGNVSQFLLNQRFAQQAYSFSEPFVARQQGAQVETLMVSDLGFNTYTSVLVANGRTIQERPELVQRLVTASIRGWRQYLASPEETNVLIHERNPEMPLDVLEFGVADLRRLCLPEGTTKDSLGQMTVERWTTLVNQMVEVGSLDAGAVRAAETHTLQFLTNVADGAAAGQ